MPTIANLNGIIIIMYLRGKEHNPSHVHAIYNEYDGAYLIENGNCIQ